MEVLEREHLVRLAFVLLDVEGIDREHQLSRAHQLARRAVGRRTTRKATDPYTVARDWLVKRIVVRENRPAAARLSWRTRMEPPAPEGDADVLRTALQSLSRLDYICYVLLVLEGITIEDLPGYLAPYWHAWRNKSRSTVAPTSSDLAAEIRRLRRDELGDVGAVLSTVTEVTGLTVDEQRKVLNGAGFDPAAAQASSRVRKRDLAPWHTRRARRITAFTVAGVLVAGVAFTGVRLIVGDDRTYRAYDVVDAGEWAQKLDPQVEAGQARAGRWTFADWPTTGATAANEDLIERAVRAWRRRGADSGVNLIGNLDARWWPGDGRRAQVIFAGKIADREIVLMTMPEHSVLARFVRYGPEPEYADPFEERLTVMGLHGQESYTPRTGSIHATLLQEQPGPQYLRSNDSDEMWLLVPPWVRDVEFSTPFDDTSGWQPIPINGSIAKVAPEYSGYEDSSYCGSSGFSIRATFTAPNGKQSKRTWVYHPQAHYPLVATSNYPQPGKAMRPVRPAATEEQLASFFCKRFEDFVPSKRVVFEPDDGSRGYRFSSLPAPEGVSEDAQLARVEKVVSGDTLEMSVLSSGDAWPVFTNSTWVRLLGADAPAVQTHRGTTPADDAEHAQCYGAEAKAKLADLAPVGSRVWVTGSSVQRPKELWLWTDTGALLNKVVIQRGYAVANDEALKYETKHVDELLRAESSARANGAGLWTACY